MRLTALLPALIATGLVAAGARADEAVPEPFKATYAVSYRGIGAGTLTFELKRDPVSGHYVYESHPNPSALARLFISRAAVERSVMEIGPDGVRPLEWHLEDGKSGKEKDGWLEFDWDAGRVSGEVEGERIELPTEPGLQDRSSIQIEVTTALLRGKEPGAIPLIDDERIKRYTYMRKENAVLDTKLGKLDAVIYESTREGSSRLSRFWMVPSLGHIPARAEQVRKGKVETVMELVKLERASGTAQSR